MHFSSGLCHLFVRMCTAITHTFFVYKKAGVNCNFTPTFGYDIIFMLIFFNPVLQVNIFVLIDHFFHVIINSTNSFK